ncbi:hypothetical protein BDF14DRAFT_1808231 [Spinellus fusiger]|nr:hypothetical protein BDF14DRAFT_1808231 [Spinellus fusiger]
MKKSSSKQEASSRPYTGFTLSQPATPRPSGSPHPSPSEAPSSQERRTNETPGTLVYASNAHTAIRRRRKESVYMQDDSPHFERTKYNGNIYSTDRSTVLDCRLHSKIDRGFFLADNDWTCYRRNYFQVSSTFMLQGIGMVYEGQDLPCMVEYENTLHPVRCFMLGISSRIANSDKLITLIQHTPKRDKGPQCVPDPKLIRPGGNLSLSSASVNQSVVTFERVQFKSATANNGKRRAAQQYYVLLTQLYAKIDSGQLVNVATCQSAPLVVRGRSPGHYAESDATMARFETAPQEPLQHHPRPAYPRPAHHFVQSGMFPPPLAICHPRHPLLAMVLCRCCRPRDIMLMNMPCHP